MRWKLCSGFRRHRILHRIPSLCVTHSRQHANSQILTAYFIFMEVYCLRTWIYDDVKKVDRNINLCVFGSGMLGHDVYINTTYRALYSFGWKYVEKWPRWICMNIRPANGAKRLLCVWVSACVLVPLPSLPPLLYFQPGVFTTLIKSVHCCDGIQSWAINRFNLADR